MLQAFLFRKIGLNRGKPRVWLDGRKLADAGFAPGVRVAIEFDDEQRVIRVRRSDAGERVISGKGAEKPVLDIENQRIHQTLGEDAGRVKVTLRTGEILIEVHPDDVAAMERVDRLTRKLEAGESLSHGELCVGGGVMADALHTGMTEGGIKVESRFVVEKVGKYLERALRNPVVVGRKTIAVEGGMEEINPAELPKVEILSAGLPCRGASLSGRSKNKISMAEAHPEVGHLFVPFLNIVKAVNPAVVLVENVPPYKTTASLVVIENVLKGWGYNVSLGEVDESLGAFEARKRMVMIAVADGLEFSWDAVKPVREREGSLGEILEDIPADDPSWKEYRYLIDKQERDIAAGKGFRMNVLGPDATKVGTLGSGYAKVRSTEPKVAHPENPALMRQLTPVEHGRVKGLPDRLLATLVQAGDSIATSHEILGNSVLWPAFCAVGRALGQMLGGAPQARRTVETIDTKPEPASVAANQLTLFEAA